MDNKEKPVRFFTRIVAKASDTFRNIFGDKPLEADIDQIIAENVIEDEDGEKTKKPKKD